ncbi:hypothetical protein INT45_006413 [Circinella minor]|uniref:F-box domain-containing protein n=1 Tax=Circinella minor TaxID=1195481 RepID=A0A8H7SD87_9FUNG|nr:hypothetical protein INT45_006413 [Circinella minor]
MNSQSLGDNDPNFQALESLWENANVGFNSNNYDAAMTNLNAAVTLIHQDVLARTLLKRAMTQKCQGNLQESIQDAYKVIELAPRSMDGYLFAVDVLRLNGSYGEAMAVHSKGTSVLEESSNSCDYYLRSDIQEKVYQLIQAKSAVQLDIDRTNTCLFKKLPLELTHHIFANLISFQDRVQCMCTCRFWQAFMLDELPRMSYQLVLGSMPKPAMKRLVSCYADSMNSNDSNEKNVAYYSGGNSKMKNGVSVSIHPDTSPLSFKFALRLLHNSSFRISSLEILTEWDEKNCDTKSLYIQTLRQNRDTLKRLTICNGTDAMVTTSAIDNCPNLSHLVVAADHSLLKSGNSSIPSLTFRGKRLCSISYKSNIAYDRNPPCQLQYTQMGGVVNGGTHPIWLSETIVQRQSVGNTMFNQPIKTHFALRRLELVGVHQTECLLDPLFWNRLPLLEHLAIKQSNRLHDNFIAISRYIVQHCQKLKTFRFCAEWDNWNEKEEMEQLRNQQENTKQFALRELVACPPYHGTTDHGSRPSAIFPSLVSRNNCQFLKVLILQMETLGVDGLKKLIGLRCPHLQDLQLHQRWISQHNDIIIEERHTTSMVKNCPALERVVLNRAKLTPTSLRGFKKASRLRSLSVLPWYMPINDQRGLRNGNLNQPFSDGRSINHPFAIIAIRTEVQSIQHQLYCHQQQHLAAYRLHMRRQPNGQNAENIMLQQSETSGEFATYAHDAAEQARQPRVPPSGTVNISRPQRILLTYKIISARTKLERLRADSTANGNIAANRAYTDISTVLSSISDVLITMESESPRPTEKIFNNYIHNYKVLTELCIGGEAFTDANLVTLITKNCQLTSIKLIECSSLTYNGIVDAFSSSSSSSTSSSSRLLPALQYLRHVTLVHMFLDKSVITSITRLPRLEELIIIECDPLEYNEVLEILNEEQQCYEYLPTVSDETPITTRTWIKHNGLRAYFIPDLFIPDQNPEYITYIFDCIPGRSSVVAKTTNDIMIAKPILGLI